MTTHSKPICKTHKEPANQNLLIRLLLRPALICCFLFCFCFSFAQTPVVDSLQTELKNFRHDTIKINTLNALSWELKNIGDYERAIKCANEALAQLSNRSKLLESSFLKEAEIISYKIMGTIYDELGDYDKALGFHFKSLKIAEEIGDHKHIAGSYNNIGLIYWSKGDDEKALDFFFKALKIYEGSGDKSKGISNTYNNIGNIHANKRAFEEALEFYFKSLKIREERGDKRGMTSSYNNIGNVLADKGDYSKALEFYVKALKNREEMGDKNGIALSHINIGLLHIEENKFSEAKKELNMGLNLSMQIGTKEWTKLAYGGLSQLDSILGNWKEAYEYHKLYSQINDSIFNDENNKQIAEMSAKYESEKKEKEIQLLNKDKEIASAENKKQKIISYSVSGGLLLVLALAFFIFRSNKKLAEKNIVIEKQNEEIARKNKDLTDSINYAQRIQSAILTSEQYLNDMFLPQGQVSSHFILYKPKDIVAGDFYWAYKTPEEKAIWVAADCTGHGVPGAFMSMIGNSLLNEIVMEKGIHEPDEILNNMRAGVIKALGQSGGDKKKDGMDAALCCWDRANNKISFSGANNSLWIIRKGEFIEIPPDSQPVGQHLVMNPFTKREFQLQQGDTLYTFTDGYCDQFGGQNGKKFKYKPFKELLISIQYKSMPEQKHILNKTIDDWRGELEQIDDICVFGVRV